MLSIRENTDGSRNTARRAFALLLVFVLAFVSFSGALALAAEDAEPPAPKFGDGLRATGGHNITAFIRWALTHADRSTIPSGSTLAQSLSLCGTDPWQYLYGSVRIVTNETNLNNFYGWYYESSLTKTQYASLTAGWSRSGHATDCQGLLDAWMTYEQGESTDINVQMNYYYWCTQTGAIGAVTRPYRIGEAVFVKSEFSGNFTHIGWICGTDASGEPLVVEARGIAFGVVVTRLSEREWTHRGLMTKVFTYPSSGILNGTGGTDAGGQPLRRDAAADAMTGAEQAPEEDALLPVWNGGVASGFAGGSGTAADPYLISSSAQLAYLSRLVSCGHNCSGEHFLITTDLVLNDTSSWESWDAKNAPANSWKPIGYRDSNSELAAFCGDLNGGWHTIYGLYAGDHNDSFVGLFGYVKKGSGCRIRNLTVAKSYIRGLNNAGGVVGYAEDGVQIENCRFFGAIEGELYTGGVAGFLQKSGGSPYVSGCSAAAHVIGIRWTGGVVGNAESGAKIEKSYFSGCAEASEDVGGVVGRGSGTAVTDCYNSGTVSGASSVGGAAGRLLGGSVRTSYNGGSVVFSRTGGGIAASADSACAFTHCYYLDSSVCPVTANTGFPAGGAFGAPKGWHELLSEGGYPGFDFENVWTFRTSGYPFAVLKNNAHITAPALPGMPDPTAQPTALPTEEPTAVPTAEPTAVPTEEPTAAPTAEPTAAPTEEPTEGPDPTSAPVDPTKPTPTPEPTEEPDPTETPDPGVMPLKGDVDLNGEVTVLDAVLALRRAMEIIALSAEAEYAADMNDDGEVTVLDAVLVLRLAMGVS